MPPALCGGSEDGQERSDGERLGGGPLGFGGLSAEVRVLGLGGQPH